MRLIIDVRKTILLATILLLSLTAKAGDSLRVLFLGNSYTEVNNLPGAIGQFAAAGGDYLYFQMNAPGGHTFEQHSTNSTSLNYLMQGNWDYVVLQEQSQRPSFSDGQVADEVYPYAKILDSLVHAYNPCAETVFYMTWGRKNGDAGNCVVWPPVCTYQGMDSLLQLRYTIMAEDNDAWLSPVAKVWRYIRNNNPSIELYQNDESHPTIAGTYAAAASFYALLYHKDPVLSSYNASLSAATANAIKAAAKTMVYDSLDKYWNGQPPLIAAYTSTNTGGNFAFTSTSKGTITSYEWDFGDGTPHSFAPNPAHTYAGAGPYTACLTVRNSCDTDRYCRQVMGSTGIGSPGTGSVFSVSPNPFGKEIKVSGLRTTTGYALYTMLGRKVAAGELTVAQPVIQLPDLASGVYFLQLYSEKGIVDRIRLVKK